MNRTVCDGSFGFQTPVSNAVPGESTIAHWFN